MERSEKIRWAPKVRREKIWQLYQNDVLGAIDEALVDEVGLALLLRCQSILLVSNRQMRCPRCGALLAFAAWDTADPIPCPTPACGWQTTGEHYHATWRHQDLLCAGVAMEAVQTYLERYPRAADARQRMLLIDQLVHTFHWDARLNLPNRSFANNLIEGSLAQVVEMLDRLSYGERAEAKEAWRETVQVMWKRRGARSPGNAEEVSEHGV